MEADASSTVSHSRQYQRSQSGDKSVEILWLLEVPSSHLDRLPKQSKWGLSSITVEDLLDIKVRERRSRGPFLSRGGKIAAKSELNVGLQIRTKISGLSNLDVVTTQVSQPRMEESIGGRFEKKRSKKQEEEDQCRETDATCCFIVIELRN